MFAGWHNIRAAGHATHWSGAIGINISIESAYMCSNNNLHRWFVRRTNTGKTRAIPLLRMGIVLATLISRAQQNYFKHAANQSQSEPRALSTAVLSCRAVLCVVAAEPAAAARRIICVFLNQSYHLPIGSHQAN